MTAVHLLTALLAISLSVAAGIAAGMRTGAANAAHPAEMAASHVRDASGVLVPVGPYRRIVSTALLPDQVLLELVEPQRLIAVSTYSLEGPRGFRFGDRAAVPGIEHPEAIAALAPDLVVVSGGDARSERLRHLGITVFDSGPMRGLSSLQNTLRQLGAVVGQPQRGEQRATLIGQQMAALAPGKSQVTAVYLSIYDGRLFGGASGTSFHDVLTAAGLRDAAGEAGFHDWPALEMEHLLRLDPTVLVTRRGMAERVRRLPGADRLRAAGPTGAIIELDGDLLDDPGFGMIDAATALRQAVIDSGLAKP